ncbi:hypothetical protein [Gemmatimonas sp.]|uniref:hypothetical protein n=1 Tax=Gemmatimonas sp. TaxID=1962908 RepID=UPI00286BC92F|nr:hypothetical protein [Gemmatimonas sp.]
MDSASLRMTAADRSRVDSRSTSHALPWQLAAVVFAATSVIVGLIWDISWHMTIGRDTFWTPAHLAIYTGGAVAGLACGFEVLRRSFFTNDASSAGVTVWRVFNGPLGGWLCIWGAVAMLTSAPFDDWWHAAYGLDVKIISPPHALLALGFITILGGALIMAVAEQGREADRNADGDAEASGVAPYLVAYTGGLVLAMLSIFTTEYHDREAMHLGSFYVVSSLVFPFALVAAARSTQLRYGATATALVYTLLMCAQAWVLPLFEGSPKLGPIRTAVTHMVSLDFPLLLLLPAIGIDLLMPRLRERRAWVQAAALGVLFLAVHALTQWPFANFLVSDASRNWFFNTDNIPYMMPPDWLRPMRQFASEPITQTASAFGVAGVLSVLSARVGLGWGNWLRSVRR